VVGDFLDMLPPYDVINQFVYPTFTALDLRFCLWLLSYNYRTRKVAEAEFNLRNLPMPKPDLETNLVLMAAGDGEKDDILRFYGRVRAEMRGRRGASALALLPGYYPILKRAVMLATLLKLGLFGALLSILYRRWK